MSWSIPHAISSPLLRVARCRSARRSHGVRGDRLEHLLGEALAAARIVAALAPAVGDELGGDVDAHGGVERDDLVVEGGEVAVLERREPARAHEHPVAARGLELDLAAEHAGLHVERALEAEHARGREVERLAVDGQADDRAVGGADDRLAGARQPVGVLGIDDRPGLVEAVEDRAGVVRRAALLGRAADAEVAVADRERPPRARPACSGSWPCSTSSPFRADGARRREPLAQAGVAPGHAASSPRSATTRCGARRAQLGGARRCARRRSRARTRPRGRRRRPRARPRPRRRARAGRPGGRRRRGSRRGPACRAGRGAGCRGRPRSARRGRRCRRRAGPRHRSRSTSPRR